MNLWMIELPDGRLALSQGAWIDQKLARLKALEYAKEIFHPNQTSWADLRSLGIRTVPVRVTRIRHAKGGRA
jgi:hypothetical protein